MEAGRSPSAMVVRVGVVAMSSMVSSQIRFRGCAEQQQQQCGDPRGKDHVLGFDDVLDEAEALSCGGQRGRAGHAVAGLEARCDAGAGTPLDEVADNGAGRRTFAEVGVELALGEIVDGRVVFGEQPGEELAGFGDLLFGPSGGVVHIACRVVVFA